MLQITAVLRVTIEVDSDEGLTEQEMPQALVIAEQRDREVSTAIADSFRFAAGVESIYAPDGNRSCYFSSCLEMDVERWEVQS